MICGDLFSGIGGFTLGMRWAGHPTAWHSEINPYACRVLERRYPTIPNLGDITTMNWNEVPRVDVLCGGFPCQDISAAHTRGPGSRSGLAGTRSGLWFSFLTGIHELSPQWVIIENVYNGWQRWLPDVRRTLWAIGYASLPIRLSSARFGAPHRRERVFVVAHADRDSEPLVPIHAKASDLRAAPIPSGHWGETSSGVLRMDDGVPNGVDRLRVTGNAVVPEMVEWIGSQIGA